MTKLGFYNFYDIYNNNRMFNPEIHAPIGDDLLYPLHYLAQVARERGISISTIDTEPLDSYDVIVFLDFPTFQNRYFKKLVKEKFKNMYLFINENKLIRPDNWKKENYQFFKRVYTWNDDFVDEEKIFKFFLPNRIPTGLSFESTQKKNFCCMIAGNKSSNHNLELYSERVRVIRWFEKNAPTYFDLYGQGWNERTFSGVFSVLNNFTLIKKIFPPRYSSYKGTIVSKNEILRDYKFSICYENARDIPGYITEKIFDCFFAGCVPVYWGAPNITDYIPENTFIDKRKFSDYSELFDFLKQLSENDYLDYLHAIEDFMGSKKILPFGAEYFSKVIFGLINEV